MCPLNLAGIQVGLQVNVEVCVGVFSICVQQISSSQPETALRNSKPSDCQWPYSHVISTKLEQQGKVETPVKSSLSPWNIGCQPAGNTTHLVQYFQNMLQKLKVFSQ